MASGFLVDLLDQLADFNRYPKYQLERRMDAFIAFFLPAVLRARLGHDTSAMWPEFPIRIHVARRQSSNIDYACFDGGARSLALVELETDAASVDEEQILRYHRALVTPWKRVVSDIEWIARGSASPDKYEVLLSQVRGVQAPETVFGLYLAPAAAEAPFWVALDIAAKEGVKPRAVSVRERWRFLSLERFAESEIETDHPGAWHAVSQALRNMLGAS